MKEYLNEIATLRREMMEINFKISELDRKEKLLLEMYDISELSCPNGMGTYGRQGSVDNTLWNAHLLYRSIRHEREILTTKYIYKQGKYYDLREEYRELNQRTFYKPMDNIDIGIQIDKYGYINGIKF